MVENDDRRCTLNMLNLFSEKSNHSIKAFQTSSDDTQEEGATSHRTSKAIVGTLLKSKDSLKIFSHLYSGSDARDGTLSLWFLRSALEFPNLKSLCGQNRSPKTHLLARIQSRNQGNYSFRATRSLSLEVIACTSAASPYEESIHSLIRGSTLTLVHLKVSRQALPGQRELNFPNLQVLTPLIFKFWKYPGTKVTAERTSLRLGRFQS